VGFWEQSVEEDGLWTKLHNEMGEACGTHGGKVNCLLGFAWRTEGKRSRGRPRRMWEENVKTVLKEIGIDGVNWIRLAQDRVSGGFL
jgi:hypothetical protein